MLAWCLTSLVFTHLTVTFGVMVSNSQLGKAQSCPSTILAVDEGAKNLTLQVNCPAW